MNRMCAAFFHGIRRGFLRNRAQSKFGSSARSAVRAGLAALLIAICAGSAAVAAVGSDPDARQVSVGNLIYDGDKTSVCFSDRFLTSVATEAGINTEKRMHAVHLAQLDEMRATPFVIMNGQEEFTLPDNERAVLKQYLMGGGFLLASASCSSEQWSASFRREMEATFGAGSFQEVPLDHPLFKTLYDITDVTLHHGGSARFEGVFIDGRLACLFSKEGLNDTEHTLGCCCCGGNEVSHAEQVVADTLVYALLQ